MAKAGDDRRVWHRERGTARGERAAVVVEVRERTADHPSEFAADARGGAPLWRKYPQALEDGLAYQGLEREELVVGVSRGAHVRGALVLRPSSGGGTAAGIIASTEGDEEITGVDAVEELAVIRDTLDAVRSARQTSDT